MSASAVVADREMERNSGLTSNERLGRSAWRASGPSRAGLEARRPGCRTLMMVSLVGSSGTESRVGPVGVVPGEVDDQFPLEGCETVRDQDQAPGALVFDGADATLDHGEAAAEPLADAATATPALEVPGGELTALIGEKVPGLNAGPPEMAFEASPHGARSGLGKMAKPMTRRE